MHFAKYFSTLLLSLAAVSATPTPTSTSAAPANTFTAVPGVPVAHIVSYRFKNTTTAAIKSEAITRFRNLNNLVRFANGQPVINTFVESVPPLPESKNPLIAFQDGIYIYLASGS